MSKKSKLFHLAFIILAFVLLLACNTPTISDTPSITSVSSSIFTIGKPKSFTVTATGNPTFILTGTLPSGITFTGATGVLSGTAVAGTVGNYTLTITASNGPVQTFNLIVSNSILIVQDGSGGIELDVVSNLSGKVTADGLSPFTSIGAIPGGLSGYTQVWDVRYDNATPLTAGDIINYKNYLSNGGTLIVIGENIGFVTRNNSIISLISRLGGGSITLGSLASNTQTVQAPFTGPNPLASITFLAGASTADPGTGEFITKDASDIGMAIVYQMNTLSGARAGRLICIFDINFLQFGADTNSQKLITNIIAQP